MSGAPTPTRPCPQCGAEWPDEIRFCGECGGRMPDATVVASPVRVQVEATAAAPPAAAPPAPVPPAPVPLRAAPPTAPSPAPPAPAGPPRIVSVVPATPLLVAPEPATLETRNDVAVDAVKEAWALVKGRLGPLAVGTVIIGLASSALSSTGIGVLALGPLQGGGFGTVALRAASGRSVELNDFFAGFSRWKRLVVSGLLVGLVVALGLVVLVVPGLYLAMATAYTPLLVIDRDVPAWAALKTSVEAVNAQLGAHVVVFLVLGALNFGGSLACGLGLLVTIPLTVVTLGVCYGRLFGFAGGVDRLDR